MEKILGVITLAHRETDIEETLMTVREMSETLKRRNWDPMQLSPREYIIELPNENALDYLI